MKKERNKLAHVRREKGFTQQRLAEESGVSLAAIQIWESRGTKNASVSKLLRVAETLGVEVSTILC